MNSAIHFVRLIIVIFSVVSILISILPSFTWSGNIHSHIGNRTNAMEAAKAAEPSTDDKYLSMSLDELLDLDIPSTLSRYKLRDLLGLTLADLLSMRVDDPEFAGKDIFDLQLADILAINLKEFKERPKVQEYLDMSLDELLDFKVANPRLKHLTLEDLLEMPMGELLGVQFGDTASDKDLRDLLLLKLEDILDITLD